MEAASDAQAATTVVYSIAPASRSVSTASATVEDTIDTVVVNLEATAVGRDGMYTVTATLTNGDGLTPVSPKSDLVLKPGMVVHVEPGIYLRGQSMGLRTAEMVEITEDGIRIMTKDLPRRIGCLA